MANSKGRLVGLSTVRFLNLLAIGLWLGGLAFFGIMAAGPLFRTTREHGVPEVAPIVVGIMLGRFSVLTYVCGVLLLVCWLADGLLVKTGGLVRRWWLVQGVASLGSLVIALYLGLALLPFTIQQQSIILPLFRKRALEDSLTAAEKLTMARFDISHKFYTFLSQINLWLLIGVLAAFCVRSAVTSRESNSA